VLSDDRWRDSYDAWKLATPPEYDGDDEPEDDCDHEGYELDILTGRAECTRCEHAWYMTDAEIERDQKQLRDYDEHSKCFGCQPAPAFRCVELHVDDEIPF
jgi:hypothetical protein